MTYTQAERTAITQAWGLLLRAAELHSHLTRSDIEGAAADERNLMRSQEEARSLVVRAAHQSAYGCKLEAWQLYGLTQGARMAHMVADCINKRLGHNNPQLKPWDEVPLGQAWLSFLEAASLAVEYHAAALARETARQNGEVRP